MSMISKELCEKLNDIAKNARLIAEHSRLIAKDIHAEKNYSSPYDVEDVLNIHSGNLYTYALLNRLFYKTTDTENDFDWIEKRIKGSLEQVDASIIEHIKELQAYVYTRPRCLDMLMETGSDKQREKEMLQAIHYKNSILACLKNIIQDMKKLSDAVDSDMELYLGGSLNLKKYQIHVILSWDDDEEDEHPIWYERQLAKEKQLHVPFYSITKDGVGPIGVYQTLDAPETIEVLHKIEEEA